MAAVIPAVTRISSRIIRVLGCNPGTMTLQGTNTYIVGTGKRRILIDTGDSDVPQYINHLRSVLNYEGIDLAHIFISHWHHDHIGGLTDILEEFKEKTKFCQVWKYPRAEEDIPKNVTIESLKDGQEFTVEGATLKIVHTPGHTEDHIVLHLLEDNAVFSGDCILGEGTAVFEDLYDYMNSLQEIANLQPSVIYPGHGNVIQNPMEKIQFYVAHRMEREQQIMDVLTNNREQTFGEPDLVKLIYVDLPEKLTKAAEANVNHHLIKLLKEQRVRKLDGLWQISDQNNYIKSR
ncbi:beta-lactamase-like protein 2 homolog [Anoplophora glabripennis]|uniref:beta-lactamase-like protein 2 homolog n=1 Tax=Anoplophora glabripennis TaxID=217634 RepID=UPI000874B0B9|nr:beta-lactamase-like protein 2 homolog [Anoplophora glabripennis]